MNYKQAKTEADVFHTSLSFIFQVLGRWEENSPHVMAQTMKDEGRITPEEFNNLKSYLLKYSISITTKSVCGVERKIALNMNSKPLQRNAENVAQAAETLAKTICHYYGLSAIQSLLPTGSLANDFNNTNTGVRNELAKRGHSTLARACILKALPLSI